MSRFAMCPNCGRRLRRVRDIFGSWDGETYICDYCAAQYDDDDEDFVPEGCSACGGPYPECRDSYPIFDE